MAKEYNIWRILLNHKDNKFVERILANSITEGDCIVWQGATHVQGYGMMRHGKKMQTVHRIMAIESGKFPDADFNTRIGHSCGNYLCVNPDHLIEQTHSEVIKKCYVEKPIKMNAFTQDMVREIREVYEQRKHEYGIQTKLAIEYGCAPNTMGLLVRGLSYAWVE